ncbi:MAG: hypothetical protein ABIJ34_01375 [archaeon]
MKIRNKVGIFSLGFFLLSITIVLAASNSIVDVFDPIIPVIQSYFTSKDFSLIVDLILYIWFFSQFVPHQLKGQYKEAAKNIGMPIGIILAISLIYLEYTTGFRASQFLPIAAALLVFAFIDLFKGEHKWYEELVNPIKAGIIFIILGMLMDMLAATGTMFGSDLSWFGKLSGLLRFIGFAVVLFGVITSIGKLFPGKLGAAMDKAHGVIPPGHEGAGHKGGDKKEGEGGEEEDEEIGELKEKMEEITTLCQDYEDCCKRFIGFSDNFKKKYKMPIAQDHVTAGLNPGGLVAAIPNLPNGLVAPIPPATTVYSPQCFTLLAGLPGPPQGPLFVITPNANDPTVNGVYGAPPRWPHMADPVVKDLKDFAKNMDDLHKEIDKEFGELKKSTKLRRIKGEEDKLNKLYQKVFSSGKLAKKAQNERTFLNALSQSTAAVVVNPGEFGWELGI